MAGLVLLISLGTSTTLLLIFLLYFYPRFRASVFRAKLWSINDELLDDRVEQVLSDTPCFRAIIHWNEAAIQNAGLFSVWNGLIAMTGKLLSGKSLPSMSRESKTVPREMLAGLSDAESTRIVGYLDRIDRAGVTQLVSGNIGSLLLTPVIALASAVYTVIQLCRGKIDISARNTRMAGVSAHVAHDFEVDFRLTARKIGTTSYPRFTRDLSTCV